MANSEKANFYAVKKGFKDNTIVKSWDECRKLTDHYTGAKFHKFFTLEDAKQLPGKKPPKPKQKLLRVKINAELLDNLLKICEENNMELNLKIEELIRSSLDVK
jgi:hypothetical protein